MPRFLLLVSSLMSTQLLPAQPSDLKQRVEPFNNENEIVYHLNQQNEKEGPSFIRNKQNHNLWLKGSYLKNKKVGNWYYYNEKSQLEMCYNFDQSRLIFVDSTIYNNVKINITAANQDQSKVQVPILLWPKELFIDEVAHNLLKTLPGEQIPPGDLPLQIKVVIDESGKPAYFVHYKFANSNLVEEPLALTNKFEWIPAKTKTQNIPSEYTLYITLKNDDASQPNFKRFRWND